jgi:hypothetical protein
LTQGLIVDSKPYDANNGIAKVKASTLRGVFRRHDNSPLFILTMRLKGLDRTGDPSGLIKAYLRPYFPGYEDDDSLVHSSLTFGINPESPTSLELHRKSFDEMAQKIREYVCDFIRH